jgi:hypothetical protein
VLDDVTERNGVERWESGRKHVQRAAVDIQAMTRLRQGRRALIRFHAGRVPPQEPHAGQEVSIAASDIEQAGIRKLTMQPQLRTPDCASHRASAFQ